MVGAQKETKQAKAYIQHPGGQQPNQQLPNNEPGLWGYYDRFF